MDSQENLFNNLTSTNERLMAEMSAYLESFSSPASNETKCEANHAEDAATPQSSSAPSTGTSVPSDTSDILSPDDGARCVPEAEARAKEQNPRSRGNHLSSIDENGGGQSSRPAVEFECHDLSLDEYFQSNSARRDPGGGEAQFDDDSLVAMARRMDAASVISDPSIICGPNEKFFALPQPQHPNGGVTGRIKKLEKLVGKGFNGRRQDNNGGVNVQVPEQQPNRQQPQKKVEKMVGKGFNSSKAGTRPCPPGTLPEQPNRPQPQKERLATPMRGCSPVASSSPSRPNGSSMGNGPENLNRASAGKYARRPRAGAAQQSEHAERPDAFETKATNSPQRERRPAKMNVADFSESGRAVRRGPDQRNGECPPRHNNAGGGTPAKRSAAVPVVSPAKEHAPDSNGTKTRNPLKGRRKNRLQKKRGGDSDDDEPMQGKGFNTRVPRKQPGSNERRAEKKKTKAPQSQPRTRSPEDSRRPPPQKEEAAEDQSNESEHSSSIDTEEEEKAELSPNDFRRPPPSPRSKEEPEDESDRSESSAAEGEDCDDSVYDSDEHTQIFYESTDDEEFDSEEELAAVGTSVADAVKDLNNKSAVTKVKSLFGRRKKAIT